MIMSRIVFQTQWGKTNEVVAAMAEGLRRGSETHAHKMQLLTDLSGEFHTVVLEAQFESLAAWEQFRHRLFSNPDFQNDRQDQLMVSGRLEFYTIEAEF